MASLSTSCAEPEDLILGFPNKILHQVTSNPSSNDVKILTTQCVQNLISFPCSLASGPYGWSGIVLGDSQEFQNLTGNNWVEPTLPVFPPNDANTPPFEYANMSRAFQLETKQWNEYTNLVRAIRNQIVSAIADVFICALHNTYTGYATSSPIDLLEHIDDYYAEMTPEALRLNDITFRQAWDPSETIELFFKRIESCVEFASPPNSYTASQILANAIDIVRQTGLFHDACDDWEDLDLVAQTWLEFKRHFTKARKRLDKRTSRQQGYANAATHERRSDIAEETTAAAVEALANLATATASDRERLNNQTTLIADLTEKVASLSSTLVQKEKDISGLKTKLAAAQNNGGRNTDRTGRGGRGQQKPNLDGAGNVILRPGFNGTDQGGYCWTHGYNVHPDGHKSSDCRSKADGHKDCATRANTMGGSTYGKPT
jgi:hypothetical protein